MFTNRICLSLAALVPIRIELGNRFWGFISFAQECLNATRDLDVNFRFLLIKFPPRVEKFFQVTMTVASEMWCFCEFCNARQHHPETQNLSFSHITCFQPHSTAEATTIIINLFSICSFFRNFTPRVDLFVPMMPVLFGVYCEMPTRPQISLYPQQIPKCKQSNKFLSVFWSFFPICRWVGEENEKRRKRRKNSLNRKLWWNKLHEWN